jgi:hypothetical protein
MCIVHAGYNNPNQIHTWTSLVDIIEIPQPHCAERQETYVYFYISWVWKTIGWRIACEEIKVSSEFSEMHVLPISTQNSRTMILYFLQFYYQYKLCTVLYGSFKREKKKVQLPLSDFSSILGTVYSPGSMTSNQNLG